MAKSSRPLTREIEVGGAPLAVTIGADGISVRAADADAGSARALTWEALVCACAGEKDLSAALAALRGHKEKGAAEGAAAPDLGDLLARIDQWLGKHRKGYRKALQPGAGADELAALEQALGGPVPAELRAWLGWHDGQGEDFVGAFVEGWLLMSAGQIAEGKKELDAEKRPGWKKGWVPFLDDDQGNYVCLCPDQSPASVREVWRGAKAHPVVAASLAEWVANFVRALEAGEFTEDPERGGFHRRSD